MSRKIEYSFQLQEIIVALLSENQLSLPFQDKNYPSALENKINIYINKIKQLTEKFNNNPDTYNSIIIDFSLLELIKNRIIESINQYLLGHSGEAYQRIKLIMDEFYALNLIPTEDMAIYATQRRFCHQGEALFRMRTSDNILSKRGEMFHIPFNLRHLVGAQRYSIPGVPCLYLGNSILVCWDELGRIDLNKTTLSRFKVNKDKSHLKLVNFALSFEGLSTKNTVYSIFDNEQVNKNYIESILHIWPIICACSFRKSVQSSSFSIEYVIPNFIIQWVSRHNDYIGLKYFSTKTKQLWTASKGFNYVFPPKSNEIKHEGYNDNLQSIFVLSSPASWQTLSLIPKPHEQETIQVPFSYDELDNLLLKNYDSTALFETERKLAFLPLGSISEDTIN